MRSHVLSVFEHTEVPVDSVAGPGVLSEEEVDRLGSIDGQSSGFFTRGFRSVKFSQFCGLVNVGERIVEILPKVGENAAAEKNRGVLLRLLRAAPDFPLHEGADVGQMHRSSPLLDVFISAFFYEVAALLRGGLLRTYVECEEDILTVRGTLVQQRQLTCLSNRPDRVACRYDDLTADNVWNRLIKAALRVVKRWLRGADLVRVWVELMAGFEEVEDVRNPVLLLENLQFSRKTHRYRRAISWVERILSLLSPELRAGRKAAPSLLFDMNRLFESVVTERMVGWARERRWTVDPQNATRHLTTIDSAPSRVAFRVRPDLLFRCGQRTAAIADAKWKHPGLSKTGFVMPDETDLYQLNAYAGVFGCEDLALIYPWSDGMTGARETVFRLPATGGLKPKVTVLCVDVGDDTLPLRLKSAHW